jgi:hypothetical protein
VKLDPDFYAHRLEARKSRSTGEGSAHELAIIRVTLNEPENGRDALSNFGAESCIHALLKLVQAQTRVCGLAAKANAEGLREIFAIARHPPVLGLRVCVF